MTGWKTKAAAALAILYGVLGWALGLHDASTAMTFVVNGLGLAGIGHKIEKNTQEMVPTLRRGNTPSIDDMTDEEFTEFVRRQQK